MKTPFVIVAGSLFLLSTSAAQAQSLIASQDFEGADMVGYSTLGGSFALNGADYLQRGSNGAPFLFEQPVTGFSGSNFVGLEDIDGAGLVDPHWLTLNAVTVTGYTSLNVSLLVAAPSLLATRYEPEDFLIVEYSLDGGAFTLLGRFVGGPGGGPLKHDTNLDGTGDVSIGAAMQRYTYSLGNATGNSLVVRVRFSSAGSQEEMAFDDIRISGVAPVTSTCGNGVREGAEVCDDGATDACGACNATCEALGTGAACDAGSASDAGDGGEAYDAGSDGGASADNDGGIDAATLGQDADVLGLDASASADAAACTTDCQADARAEEAGAVSQLDACGGDCGVDAASADAAAGGGSDACSGDCTGASASDDASTHDAAASGTEDEDNDDAGDEDNDEGNDEEMIEDISAAEGADAGAAPRKRHGDGCSVAATKSARGESPLLLSLGTLLAAMAYRRRTRPA